MEKRFWEVEYFAMDSVIGKLVRVLADFLIEHENMEGASGKLALLGSHHYRLSGNWFKTPQDAINTRDFYDALTDPHNIVKGMSYDDFIDWLNLSSEREDIVKAIARFKEAGDLEDHIKVMELHLKLKYDVDTKTDDDA